MSAYKDQKTGKWYVFFYYRNWQGENKGKTKRGFATKREALEWERNFKLKQSENLDMTMNEFYKLYEEDMKPKLKLNTWLTKKHIITGKVLPYFGERKMNEITAADILKWQNVMIESKKENGERFKPGYLKTVHDELSCLFNHAVRFYNLNENPSKKAGNMGKESKEEMLFWTKEEYLKFADVIKDKPQSYYAFEILYWCGIRVGELLALTMNDFDLEKKILTINKSNNLAAFGHAKAFELCEEGFRWCGNYEITADEVLGGIIPKGSKLEQAKQFLRELSGENVKILSTEIIEQAKQEGISKRTLETAKNELGINAKKVNNSWYWDLSKYEV